MLYVVIYAPPLFFHLITIFFRWTCIRQYQSVSVVDFIGAKDVGGGGDSWSYKMCRAPVKWSSATNQRSAIYRPDALIITQPRVSKHKYSSVSNSDAKTKQFSKRITISVHKFWSPLMVLHTEDSRTYEH